MADVRAPQYDDQDQETRGAELQYDPPSAGPSATASED